MLLHHLSFMVLSAVAPLTTARFAAMRLLKMDRRHARAASALGLAVSSADNP